MRLRLRLRWKLLIVAALAVALIGEFVADIRTPRAAAGQSHALGANVSIGFDDVQPMFDALKKKYGTDT